MKNVDKCCSFKLSKKENNIKKAKASLHNSEKNKSLSRSNQDLIGAETEETIDRSEEAAKIAEEAYAANLKLLKKQKARFLRLQKILSRNVILIPLCAIFSVLSAASLFVSTLSNHYELISYDINSLRRNIELENNLTLNQVNSLTNLNLTINDLMNIKKSISSDDKKVDLDKQSQYVKGATTKKQTVQRNLAHNTDRLQSIILYNLTNIIKDYYIVTRRNYLIPDNSSIKINILYETHSGIWKFCNQLSPESRKILNLDKCTFYKTANLETENNFERQDVDLSDPGRDLVRMHNAAACCTIVSYFLLIFSWITAITAAISKKVPVTLATCVLNLLIAVFLGLLLAIFHRKIITEEKRSDCYDLKIVFNIVCSSRTVKFGYSLGLTWLSLFFTILNGICWFHITKMQKLLFAHGYYY